MFFQGNPNTTYFRGPKKCTLRVRDFGHYTLITLKKVLSEKRAKVAQEIEVKTKNYKRTVKLFENLGYRRMYEIVKRRVSYSLGKFRFEFDTYKGIPTFMEIEGPSYDKIVKMAAKLGIPKKDLKPLSRSQLFKRYGIRP